MPTDRDALYDIILACRRVMSYVERKTLEDMQQDLMLQDAVVRRIEIIGEAAKRLSLEFRAAHPTVPWQQMAGMRDRLIHGYDKVDVARVWQTATQTVKSLLPELERILASVPDVQ